MIEQGIYFVLGCIVTALAALLFAPVFWRRALRLTRQRLALQVPLSMQEILAQRDQIRAEFAVERLRLEHAMEIVQAGKAADMAEIGRRSMELAKVGEELSILRQTEQAQLADVERLQKEVADLSAALSALPVQSDDGGDRRPAEAAPARNETAQIELDTLRATVASLKTRGMGLEARLKDAERGAGDFKENEASLRARLETAMGHVSRHEAAGLSVRRELDDAKTHIRQLEQQLETARSARERPTPHADDMGGKGPDRLELLTAENAALQRALAAIRREPGGDDDAGLRETIHALGLAVAKLTREGRERDASESMPRLPVAAAHPLSVV